MLFTTIKTAIFRCIISPKHSPVSYHLIYLWVLCSKKHWEDDFLESQFQQQVQALQQLQLEPFQLKVGGINSFDSALFVEVQDQSQQLARIRQALSVGGAEIAALQYHPHITLGLYQTACSTNLILQRIQNLPCNISI